MGYIITAILVFLAIFGINYGINEDKFNRLPMEAIECTLLSQTYSASTRQSRLAPIIGSNGTLSTAIYTTGDSEKKITEWDCGKFGRLISDDAMVYRFAKEKSVLYIRSNSYDTRIVGIAD